MREAILIFVRFMLLQFPHHWNSLHCVERSLFCIYQMNWNKGGKTQTVSVSLWQLPIKYCISNLRQASLDNLQVYCGRPKYRKVLQQLDAVSLVLTMALTQINNMGGGSLWRERGGTMHQYENGIIELHVSQVKVRALFGVLDVTHWRRWIMLDLAPCDIKLFYIITLKNTATK